MLSIRSVSIFILLGYLGSVGLGCSRWRSPIRRSTDDAGTIVQKTEIGLEYKKSLDSQLIESLIPSFKKYFAAGFSVTGLSDLEKDRLTSGLALTAATTAGSKINGQTPTLCHKTGADSLSESDWHKCIILEILVEDFGSAVNLQRAVTEVSQNENRYILDAVGQISKALEQGTISSKLELFDQGLHTVIIESLRAIELSVKENRGDLLAQLLKLKEQLASANPIVDGKFDKLLAGVGELSTRVSTLATLHTNLVTLSEDVRSIFLGFAIQSVKIQAVLEQLRLKQEKLETLLNEAGIREQSLLDLLIGVSASLDRIANIVDLIANRDAKIDMPFLAKSFFENRRFVLTSAVQQHSIGSGMDRVYNFSGDIVKLVVNNGRLVVMLEKGGLYSAGAAQDLIITAFPIVASREVDGEVYYQIDFSLPLNGEIRLRNSYTGESADSFNPITRLETQLIVPRVAHARKKVIPALGSGLYFESADKALVLDQLVLIKNAKRQFEATPNDRVVGKDELRPTIRFSQGFFVIDESSESFAAEQALNADDANKNLQKMVNFQSNDVPFFTANKYFLRNASGMSSLDLNVRKFNTENELVFVISANTPKLAVPVVKAAVNVYRDLFVKIGSDLKIRALTQDEFEAANRDSGLLIGGKVNAADPRVNMIQWDDDMNLGAAWATTTMNPQSGEVISGDVLLSGHLWALEGCMGWLQRTWKPSATELFPSFSTRQLWKASCFKTLMQLGLGAPYELTEQALQTKRLQGTFIPGTRPDPRIVSSDAFRERVRSVHAEVKRKESVAQRFFDRKFGANQNKSSEKHVELSSDAGLFRATFDCHRSITWHDISEEVAITSLGYPDVKTDLIRNPTEAAMALVKSTVVHEIGHLLGLRHNFLGSVKSSEILDSVVPLQSRSDSVMDYNDYSVDFDAGAIRDISDSESGSGLGQLGVYDVLALSTLYNGNAGIKFTDSRRRPQFCSDNDVTSLSQCQSYDFGNDYFEYLLLGYNQRLIRAQTTGFGLQDLISAAKNLDDLSMIWVLQQMDTTSPSAAKMLFTGQADVNGYRNHFLTELAKTWRIRGIASPLEPGELTTAVGMLKNFAQISLGSANVALANLRVKSVDHLGEEQASLPSIVRKEDRDFLRTSLLSNVIIPAGTMVFGFKGVDFEEPSLMSLPQDIFNASGVVMEDPLGRSGVYVGEFGLSSMKLWAGLAASLDSGWYGEYALDHSKLPPATAQIESIQRLLLNWRNVERGADGSLFPLIGTDGSKVSQVYIPKEDAENYSTNAGNFTEYVANLAHYLKQPSLKISRDLILLDTLGK